MACFIVSFKYDNGTVFEDREAIFTAPTNNPDTAKEIFVDECYAKMDNDTTIIVKDIKPLPLGRNKVLLCENYKFKEI